MKHPIFVIAQFVAAALAVNAQAQLFERDYVAEAKARRAQETTVVKAPPTTLADAARSAFESVREIARLNPSIIGLSSQAEVEQAVMGAPLPIYSVKTPDLAKYDGTGDPNPLLMSAGKVLYPVIHNGVVKASFLIVRSQGEWTLGPIGEGPTAADLSRAVNALGARRMKETRFLVHIGALRDAYFVARRSDGKSVQDSDPSKASTQLVSVRMKKAVAVRALVTDTLAGWMVKLAPAAAKAVKWSTEAGSSDTTPPGPRMDGGPLQLVPVQLNRAP